MLKVFGWILLKLKSASKTWPPWTGQLGWRFHTILTVSLSNWIPQITAFQQTTVCLVQ